MRLLKTVRLILTFYRSFFLACIIITGCCLIPIYQYGLKSFFGIFWLKIASLGLVFYFINTFKSKEFFYYQNLGIAKELLWGLTLLIDFVIFIFLVILTYQMR